MDVKDRLEQVSDYLHNLDVVDKQYELSRFAYEHYKSNFSNAIWKCEAYYNSPLGNFEVEVRIELGEYFTKITIHNEYRTVYKEVIDIEA